MNALEKTRARKIAAGLGAALIAALYVLAARRLPVGVYNDDAANVLLARSMSHGSYSFPGGLGAPEEFLPAFPALLVVPSLLVEPHWNYLRAIPLFFAALCLFLTWRLARRFLSVEASAAAVLLAALNPIMVGLGGLVLPHLPYLALSLALIDGVGADESRPAFLLLAAGAGVATLLRPVGAVLIACLALAQFQRQGLKRGVLFLLLALLPALAWTARNHLRAGSSLDYVDTWRAHIVSLGDTPLLERASRVVSTLFGDAFLGIGTPVIQTLAGAAVLPAALFGALVLLKKRQDVRVFVLASYTAGLVFLHTTWKWIDPRYVIPFVPLLWILIIAAAAKILDKRRALACSLLTAVLFLPLRSDVARARMGLDGAAQFQPRTMAWIRENVPPSARMASAMKYAVPLLTERECAGQGPALHAAPWLAAARLHHVEYLHVILPRAGDEFGLTDFPEGYQPAFARWLDTRPEAKQVFRDLDEGALVYRLDPL